MFKHSSSRAILIGSGIVALVGASLLAVTVWAAPSEWAAPYHPSRLEFLVLEANTTSLACGTFNGISKTCLRYQYAMTGPSTVTVTIFAPKDTSIATYEDTVEEAKTQLRQEATGYFPGRSIPRLDIEVRRMEIGRMP